MDYIKNRIQQLEEQLDNPEVLDQLRVEIKLEAYRECLQGLVHDGELSDVRLSLPSEDDIKDRFPSATTGFIAGEVITIQENVNRIEGALWLLNEIKNNES